MNKLYYRDPYIKEFTTYIEEIVEKDKRYHIVLNKTAFFPGGGGQFSDIGYIDGKKVIEVYEDNKKIYHVIEEQIKEMNNNIKCKIDWEKRFDGMQQHLAQHVLSGCFFKEFGQNTVSFHMGKESSTVDIRGKLDEKKVAKIELMANEVISKNLKVRFFMPTRDELNNINLRRSLPTTDEDISILEIEDLDINACCGVHPKSTLELQAIKIVSYRKNKDCTRIEFLAGKRAINNMISMGKINKSICEELTCGEGDLLSTIRNIKQKNDCLLEENREVKIALNRYIKKELRNRIVKIKDINTLSMIYNDDKIIVNNDVIKYRGELKDIVLLLNELLEYEKMVILLGNKQGERGNLVFMKSKDIDLVDIKLIFKKSIDMINGKGGGSMYLVQGSGKSEKIEETIQFSKETLNLIINNI